MIEEDSTEEIVLNLTDQEFLILAKMAHDKDITFNQLIENILKSFLKIV